ncbi:MAG: MFS transporter [Candidatus Dormiibacterota bacterium]|jgi:EmrB/QacA subfamily drug resistance transporter
MDAQVRTGFVTASAAASGAPSRRRWLVLLAMVAGLFMPMLDLMVVNVALPTIQRDLSAGISGLQWIVDGYTLAFAALLLTGGILGDRYGRRRIFLAGLVAFTAASALSGLSQTTAELIATRALQGVGAALLVPGTLSIIAATFSGRERGMAIGVWGAVSGLAVAIGPVIGGLLVVHTSWRSVFFLNVPVGLAALALALAVVPDSRDDSCSRRLDMQGLATGTAAVTALTYGLIEGNTRGWSDPWIVASLVMAGLLFAAFIAIEARRSAPMLPLAFFRNPTFSAANVVGALLFFAMIGSVFFLTLYLQNVNGYTPEAAGIRLLPFSGMILLLAPIAGRTAGRSGSRWLMTVGPLLLAIGLGLLLRTAPQTAYGTGILPAFLVMGAGWAITLAPMTTAVMSSVSPDRAGVASAVANTSRELGGVLGVAALGAVVTAAFGPALQSNLMKAGVAHAQAVALVARAGTQAVTGGDPPAGSAVITRAIQQSFVDAMHVGLWMAIAAAGTAALVSASFVRRQLAPEMARRGH